MGTGLPHFSPVVEAKKLGPSPSKGKYRLVLSESCLLRQCIAVHSMSRLRSCQNTCTCVQCTLILQPRSH